MSYDATNVVKILGTNRHVYTRWEMHMSEPSDIVDWL